MRSHARLARGLLVVVGLVLSVRDASAQEARTTGTATVLFDEAVAQMERGQYAEACPKLARSNTLSPNGGTLFALAQCYERGGKIASAWVTYKEVAIRAAAAKRRDAEKTASAAVERLASSVSKLTVVVPRASVVEGLAIEIDGRPMAREEWGVATPIDPGSHKIRIMAPRRVPVTRDVIFLRFATQQTVTVPALEPEAEHVAPAKPAPVDRGAPRGGAQRMVGFFVGGSGLVGLGIGTFFGLRALSRNDEAAAHCSDRNVCDADGMRLDREGRDASTISTVAFVAGGALVAGGLVLVLSAPSGREKSASGAAAATVAVSGTPGGAALTLGAPF